jgi:hypothetical protein
MEPPCVAREKTMSLEYHRNPRASNLITDHASKGYLGHQFSDALEDLFSIPSISLADLGGE